MISGCAGSIVHPVTNADRFAAPPCCPVCGTRTCMPYVCDPDPMPVAQAREILGRRLDERALLQLQSGGWLRALHTADAAGDFEAAARAADQGIEGGTLTRKLVTMSGHGLNMAFYVYRRRRAPPTEGGK